MVEFERLSGSESDSYQKVFILIDFLIAGLLIFASIGIISNFNLLLSPGQLFFYLIFLLVLATIPSIYDQLTKDDNKELVDTVSIEDEDAQLTPALANWKVQVGLGLFLAILIGYQITASNAIYVQYPVFSIPVPFLTGQSTLIFNAVIAAIASGYVETRVFWSFIMPTIYNIIQRKYDSTVLAMVGSTFLTSSIFVGYHLFVYSSSQVALTSVFIFALINSLLLIFTRGVIAGMSIHIANNAIGSILNISRSIFGIVF